MSISISEFKAWAGHNRNVAVAVVDGALADASNQIGVVERLFKRGTVNGYMCHSADATHAVNLAVSSA